MTAVSEWIQTKSKIAYVKTTYMKTTFAPRTALVVAAVIFLHLNATAAEVGLGTANDFAVLAGSAVTSTGPTVINKGDVGVSAGSAITGFPPGTVTAPNTFHAADAVAAQAQTDLTTA